MGLTTGTRRGDADLVERYINTAYDNVKLVADSLDQVTAVADGLESALLIYDSLGVITSVNNNLPSINIVSTNIAAVNNVSTNILDIQNLNDDMPDVKVVSSNAVDISYVAANMAEITEAATANSEFSSIYYGKLADNPTTRPNGDPMQDGDLYFNSAFNYVFVRVDGNWNSISANLVSNDSIIVAAENIVGTDTVVTLPTSYGVGRNNIIVFVNQILVMSTLNSANGVYEETDSNTLTFPNLLLEVGDEVSVITGTVVDTINPVVSVTKLRYVTSTTFEQAVVLPNNQVYSVGSNNLEVYLEGKLQFLGVDYFETNSTTVTFATSIPDIGTEVIFKTGSLIGTVAQEVTQEGDVVVYDLATDFFVKRLVTDTAKVVYLASYATANDGRSGSYVYDGTRNKSEADGLSLIDPNVDLSLQGSGGGQGVWVLQMGLVAERIDEYLGAIYDTI